MTTRSRRGLIYLGIGVAALAMIGFIFVRASRMVMAPSGPALQTADGRPESVEVQVKEGTSMAVALSPDGRTLAVALFGSLWTMPVTGGVGSRITDELFDAAYPAWAPDGKSIAFQGFRAGDYDIWSIAPDGSGAKQLTTGPADDREPHWSPDGARLAFTSDRSGNSDIWILDIRSGEMRQATTNPADDYMPAWSPDGRSLAFVSTRSSSIPPPAGPIARIARAGGTGIDERTGVWALDVDSGTERLIAGVTGNAFAPSWSPHGTVVLYGVIADAEGRLDVSGQTLAAGEDVSPFRAQWPSPTEFIYTADGKIKRRSFYERNAHIIDFTLSVPVRRASYARHNRDFSSNDLRPVRGIDRPAISPDGRRVVFAALGDLWVMTVGSKPERLTHDRFMDTEPNWSPDGSRIVFSSDRAGGMDLWIRDMQTGEERQLTRRPTADMSGAWSRDGTRIAFRSVALRYSDDICVVDVSTGTVHTLLERVLGASAPTWAADGRTIVIAALDAFGTRFRDGANRIVAIPVEGAAEPRVFDPAGARSIADTRFGDGPVWSPDGTAMAFVQQGALRVLPVKPDGEPAGDARRLTSEPANSPSWTADSQNILYLSPDGLKLISVADAKVQSVPLDLKWQMAVPAGRRVVHAGLLFDGRDAGMRRSVDIVIDGNRITAVDPHRTELHTGDVINASGKLVIPGLIDMHSRQFQDYGEALGRVWLAYGITSVRDPAGTDYRSIHDREAIDAGTRPGPRMFTSGHPFDGTRVYDPQNYATDGQDQMTGELDRQRRLGHDVVAISVRLRDEFQKRLVEIARESGTPVTTHEIYPSVFFGVDGVEHLQGTSRRGFSATMTATGNIYDDVIGTLSRSGATLTPTIALGSNFEVVAAEDPAVMNDPRLQILPAWALDPIRQRVEQLRKGDRKVRDKVLMRQARSLERLLKANGRIVAGTDAPAVPYGASLGVELELYVRGGLRPAQAIQTATIRAAEALGAGADLGTIEPGKLADLVVLNGNPFLDMRTMRSALIVIKNGEVFPLENLLRGATPASSAAMRKD